MENLEDYEGTKLGRYTIDTKPLGGTNVLAITSTAYSGKTDISPRLSHTTCRLTSGKSLLKSTSASKKAF